MPARDGNFNRVAWCRDASREANVSKSHRVMKEAARSCVESTNTAA